MRKVLAITVALMIAAVVLSPAMGYTIQSAGNQSYTVQSEKVNYTFTSGTPGHALTLDMIPGKTTPGAAVQVVVLGAAVERVLARAAVQRSPGGGA